MPIENSQGTKEEIEKAKEILTPEQEKFSLSRENSASNLSEEQKDLAQLCNLTYTVTKDFFKIEGTVKSGCTKAFCCSDQKISLMIDRSNNTITGRMNDIPISGSTAKEIFERYRDIAIYQTENNPDLIK